MSNFIVYHGYAVGDWLICEGHRYIRLSNTMYNGKRGYFMLKGNIVWGFVPE